LHLLVRFRPGRWQLPGGHDEPLMEFKYFTVSVNVSELYVQSWLTTGVPGRAEYMHVELLDYLSREREREREK